MAEAGMDDGGCAHYRRRCAVQASVPCTTVYSFLQFSGCPVLCLVQPSSSNPARVSQVSNGRVSPCFIHSGLVIKYVSMLLVRERFPAVLY